jgi:hypothetical protein
MTFSVLVLRPPTSSALVGSTNEQGVIPAKAGIHVRTGFQPQRLDSRFRGNDGSLLALAH